MSLLRGWETPARAAAPVATMMALWRKLLCRLVHRRCPHLDFTVPDGTKWYDHNGQERWGKWYHPGRWEMESIAAEDAVVRRELDEMLAELAEASRQWRET